MPDIFAIGTHSLRRGGAIAAANACVPDCLFKRHDCWSSESAKDGYVKDSLSSRSSVRLQQVDVQEGFLLHGLFC